MLGLVNLLLKVHHKSPLKKNEKTQTQNTNTKHKHKTQTQSTNTKHKHKIQTQNIKYINWNKGKDTGGCSCTRFSKQKYKTARLKKNTRVFLTASFVHACLSVSACGFQLWLSVPCGFSVLIGQTIHVLLYVCLF